MMESPDGTTSEVPVAGVTFESPTLRLPMPLFEFRCRACGDDFEVLVRNRESPCCPECGGAELDRLMSAPVGHVGAGATLPITGAGCPPRGAPPCGPGCCRLPTG